MRNFIDIVSSQQEPQILLEDELLLEGRQYRDMLTSMTNLAERYPDCKKLIMDDVIEIQNVCDGLKRKDRQIWAARQLRLEALMSLERAPKVKSNEGLYNEIQQMIVRFQADFQKTVGHPFVPPATSGEGSLLDMIRRVLVNHFMAIPYAPIQKYIFSPAASWTQIVADLTHLEDDYKELSSGLVVPKPEDKIVLTFPNGYCWMLLPRAYCNDEANAMGHCGNGGGSYGERILSLRQFAHSYDGEKYYHVYLTFILDSNGRLGEMKGRNNDKPVPRYHTYIKALLLLDLIKGIKGGGYRPENNFSLDDLPKDEVEALIKQKPSLGTLNQQFALLGDTPEVRANALVIAQEILGNKAKMRDDGILIADQWKNLPDIVSDLCKSEWWEKVVNADGFDDWEFDLGDEDSCASLLDDLPVREQIAIATYAQNLVENNGDEDQVDDFDMSSTKEVIEALKEYDEDVYDIFAQAVASGHEAGAHDDAYKALYRAIEDANNSMEFGTLEIPTANGHPAWDDPYNITLDIPDISKMEERYLDTNEDNSIKMLFWDGAESPINPQEPHYGFSGWDKDVAISHLHDYLDIEGLDEARKSLVEELPDFDTMAPKHIREWIKGMYAKIPDGFIYKGDVDEMPETRLPDVARSLWKKYYGKPK